MEEKKNKEYSVITMALLLKAMSGFYIWPISTEQTTDTIKYKITAPVARLHIIGYVPTLYASWVNQQLASLQHLISIHK